MGALPSPSRALGSVARVIPALSPPSPEIAGHRKIGMSTGAMPDYYGRWPQLASESANVSTAAVELSALSEAELPSLVRFLTQRPALPFLFVSVHGPAKGRQLSEQKLVEILLAIAGHVDAIVMHPDAMAEPSCFRALGSKLVIENMDNRKRTGQSAADLSEYFAELPKARLCLDVAHAASADPTLGVAHEILDVHGPRLLHLHLSSLDEECHHLSLTETDEQRFMPVLDRCRDVPWILEAAPR